MILDILRDNGYKLEEDFSKEVAKAETILGITFAKDYREALAKFGNFEVNNPVWVYWKQGLENDKESQ